MFGTLVVEIGQSIFKYKPFQASDMLVHAQAPEDGSSFFLKAQTFIVPLK